MFSVYSICYPSQNYKTAILTVKSILFVYIVHTLFCTLKGQNSSTTKNTSMLLAYFPYIILC